MRCNQCGTENSADSAFCMNCGFNLSASQEVATAAADTNVNANSADVNTAPAETYAAPENNVAENVPVTDNAVNYDAANYGANESYNYTEGNYGDTPYQENAAPAKKKKAWLIPAIVAVAVIAVVVVAIVVLISIFGGKYVFRENEISVVPCDGTYLVLGNGELLDKIEAERCNIHGTSLSGDVCALVADGELYVVADSSVESVAEDVSSVVVAREGTALLYKDNEGALYHYDIDSGDTTDVAEDVDEFAISSDGESYVYSVKDSAEDSDNDSDSDYSYDYDYAYGDSSSGTYTVYLYDGSESVKIGSDYTAVSIGGISDDAEYTYVTTTKDGKTKLYAYLDAAEDKMVLGNNAQVMQFNVDRTQALISSEKGTYIFDDGEDPFKLSSKSLYPMMPSGAVAVKDFFDIAYAGNGAIYYVDGDGNAEKIADDASDAKITKDGDVVYYLDDDTLCVIDVDVDAEAEELATDVRSFKMTADGDEVYYENTDDELYCYTGGSTDDKISKFEVSEYDVSAEGVCFFRCDDELYYCDNGSSAEKICGGVKDLMVGYYNVWYFVDGDDCIEVYLSDGSDDFEMVYDYEP